MDGLPFVRLATLPSTLYGRDTRNKTQAQKSVVHYTPTTRTPRTHTRVVYLPPALGGRAGVGAWLRNDGSNGWAGLFAFYQWYTHATHRTRGVPRASCTAYSTRHLYALRQRFAPSAQSLPHAAHQRGGLLHCTRRCGIYLGRMVAAAKASAVYARVSFTPRLYRTRIFLQHAPPHLLRFTL